MYNRKLTSLLGMQHNASCVLHAVCAGDSDHSENFDYIYTGCSVNINQMLYLLKAMLQFEWAFSSFF